VDGGIVDDLHASESKMSNSGEEVELDNIEFIGIGGNEINGSIKKEKATVVN
jgi:hypothetical protein